MSVCGVYLYCIPLHFLLEFYDFHFQATMGTSKIIIALVLMLISVKSFAVSGMYLEITNTKGDTIRTAVDDNGIFVTPPMSPGHYKVTWGIEETPDNSIAKRSSRELNVAPVSAIIFSYEIHSGKSKPKAIVITKEMDKPTILQPAIAPVSVAEFSLTHNCDELFGSITLRDANGNKISTTKWAFKNGK